MKYLVKIAIRQLGKYHTAILLIYGILMCILILGSTIQRLDRSVLERQNRRKTSGGQVQFGLIQ